MSTFDSESYNQRSSKLGNGEVQGCPVCGGARPSKTAKYCGAACYHAVQRSADPVARFWSKVDRTTDGDGCWPWLASRSGGRTGGLYGQFTYADADGQRCVIGAHVYAYQLANGPVPDGLEVMHKCHNRVCCRPSHLEAGTHAQNVQDSAAAGHYHVPRPRRQALSDEQVEDMLTLRQRGFTLKEIADQFGVSQTYVSLVARGLRRQYSKEVA